MAKGETFYAERGIGEKPKKIDGKRRNSGKGRNNRKGDPDIAVFELARQKFEQERMKERNDSINKKAQKKDKLMIDNSKVEKKFIEENNNNNIDTVSEEEIKPKKETEKQINVIEGKSGIISNNEGEIDEISKEKENWEKHLVRLNGMFEKENDENIRIRLDSNMLYAEKEIQKLEAEIVRLSGKELGESQNTKNVDNLTMEEMESKVKEFDKRGEDIRSVKNPVRSENWNKFVNKQNEKYPEYLEIKEKLEKISRTANKIDVPRTETKEPLKPLKTVVADQKPDILKEFGGNFGNIIPDESDKTWWKKRSKMQADLLRPKKEKKEDDEKYIEKYRNELKQPDDAGIDYSKVNEEEEKGIEIKENIIKLKQRQLVDKEKEEIKAELGELGSHLSPEKMREAQKKYAEYIVKKEEQEKVDVKNTVISQAEQIKNLEKNILKLEGNFSRMETQAEENLRSVMGHRS